MSFQIGQTVYLLNDIQKLTIIKDLGNLNYIVKTHNDQHIQVSNSQITDDKDLVIQKLSQLLLQTQQDYKDSRDAWWRLKDEVNYYKNLNLNKK
jgi:hypothetical protein|tara:strand:- start:751 stop:1032 length:282 start_codon:yes stop_codon:yes gene_type:complete